MRTQVYRIRRLTRGQRSRKLRFLARIRRNRKTLLQPWQLLLLIVAGWINRTQQDAVEHLITENRILTEKLGKHRILLKPHTAPAPACTFFRPSSPYYPP